jgi:hypothetical protein
MYVNEAGECKTPASFIAISRSLYLINIDQEPIPGMSLWRGGSLTRVQHSSKINDNLNFYQLIGLQLSTTATSGYLCKRHIIYLLSTFSSLWGLHDEICLVPFELLRLETASIKLYRS